MFQSVDEIEAAVKALIALAMNYNRGDVIPYDEIEPIAGERKFNRGKTIIKKWRDRLRNQHKIATWCVTDVGIELLTHEKTATTIPKKRNRKMGSQTNKCLGELKTVDTSALSDHQRNNFVASESYMLDSKDRIKSAEKSTAVFLRHRETMPLRPLA